jgi:integrase
MRWNQRTGNYFVFFRRKTETTRKSNKQEIIVPVNEKVQRLLDKIGDRESEFILGLLKENYSEQFYDYVSRKERKKINKLLGNLSQKLNLSVPLKLQTARDTYATVLKRSGVSRDIISEMLNHSNTLVTSHYLASLDMEKTFEINDCLI